MRLVEMTGEGTGRVDAGGVRTDVSLMMVPQAQVGDYLIVHAGFGIEILDQEEARIRLELFKEIAEATSGLEDY
jgi:hydrogenase expression/formation protein HypC